MIDGIVLSGSTDILVAERPAASPWCLDRMGSTSFPTSSFPERTPPKSSGTTTE
jgi:hypothetical protein